MNREQVRATVDAIQPRLWLALRCCALLPPYNAARLRRILLRLAGIDVGAETVIGGRLWIAGGLQVASRVTIGRRCFINDGLTVDGSAPVRMGDHVFVGHDVALLTSSHEIGPPGQRAGEMTTSPIVIGDGCWIGARATVLAGVTIGSGAVVAAGAVVVQSVPADTLVGGIPARIVRELDGAQPVDPSAGRS
jgi:acetyltransferase-like isoleucine patch superfamily enzyme